MARKYNQALDLYLTKPSSLFDISNCLSMTATIQTKSIKNPSDINNTFFKLTKFLPARFSSTKPSLCFNISGFSASNRFIVFVKSVLDTMLTLPGSPTGLALAGELR